MAQDIPTNGSGYTSGGGLEGRTLASLTDDEIRSIAEAWLLNALKDTNLFLMQIAPERERLAGSRLRRQGKKATPEEVQDVLESLGYVEKEEPKRQQGRERPLPSFDQATLDNTLAEHAQADAEFTGRLKDIYQKSLAGNRVTRIAFEVDEQIEAMGLTVDPSSENAVAVVSEGKQPSPVYLKTCQELLKARASFYGILEQNRRGDFTAYDATVERLEARQEERREKRQRIKVAVDATASTVTAIPTRKAQSGLKLIDVLPQFFKEKEREGN